MTNKGGSGNEKVHSRRKKPKMLPAGKLNDQRNLIRHNKSTTRTFLQTSLASVQPKTPVQPAASVQPATLVQPAAPVQPASSVQPATLVQPAASVQPAALVQPAAPSDRTLSHVHASTPEVLRFMPTPGICLQTMVGSSQNVSREATIEEDVQQTSSDEDGVENEVDHEDDEVEVSQGNVPPIVHRKDDNGKIIIRPFGKTVVPASEVASAINYAIRLQFYTPIYSWSQLDEATYKKWFGFFAEKLSWDPRDHEFVEKAFKTKGARRLTDMLTKARKKKTRPAWISGEAWTGLQDEWKKEKFQKVSKQNKANRASKRGGALHTSGRKAHVDVALELSNNLQKDLFPDELFLRTHKRKSCAWVDTRSEDTYAKYNKKLATVQAQIGETSGDAVQKVDGGTKLKLWTESAGGRNRGRVYGTADLSVNLRHGSTSFIQQSNNSHGSMYVSLEAERAIREVQEAKARAEEAIAEAQEAKADSKASAERTQKLENDLLALRALFMKHFDPTEHGSAKGSCSPNLPPNSHPDYDDDLDDQSLDGDLDDQSMDGDT